MSEPTPLSLLARVAAHDPDRVAAIDVVESAEPIMTTRGQLLGRSLALAQQLRARGVARGDCIAVWLPNWSDALAWQFAAVACEAHVIGVNTRYHIDDVAHVFEQARPKVVAIAHRFHDLDLRERLHAALRVADIPPPSVAVVAAPGAPQPEPADCADYDVGAGAWVPSAQAEPCEGVFEGRADALAVAFTTSGSTGKPKLAAHTAGAVAEHALAVAGFEGWGEDDVLLCALPLTGVFAYVPAMATIAAGGVCLLEPVFDADAIVVHMARFGVTRVVGADDIVGRIAQAWKARPLPLPAWRRILIADFNGKSQELAAWAEKVFGVVVSGVYGSSELFALLAIRPAGEAVPKRWHGGGTPVSTRTEVRAAAPDTGECLPAGAAGELQFRGPTVVDAYLGRPGLRAQQLTRDGWFRSGDMGVVAADGSFDYVCRLGDALRLRGFLVEPAEIEARLSAHPAVDMAKVVGIRSAEGDTAAIGFVQLKQAGAVDGAALRAWCAETLAAYKVPRAVHVIDAMPTTSGVNGIKIKAAVLREWASALETAVPEATATRPRAGT